MPSTGTTAVVAAQVAKPHREKETHETSASKKSMSTLTSLYVHNIPPTTNSRELNGLFSVVGKVLRVDCHQDRGFAFVNFESQEVVKAALQSTEQFVCQGNVLRIESRDRTNDGIGKLSSPHAKIRKGGSKRKEDKA